MCNVCEHRAHRSSSSLLLFHIFLISGLSKSTAGCLVWQRSGTLARLVYSFVYVHFAQSIQSVQNTCECVCVCLSHSFSVAYFILAILFTVSDECISSFVTSSSVSCDIFLSLSSYVRFFVLSSSRYHTFFIHSRLLAFITSKRTSFAVNSKKMNRK